MLIPVNYLDHSYSGSGSVRYLWSISKSAGLLFLLIMPPKSPAASKSTISGVFLVDMQCPKM